MAVSGTIQKSTPSESRPLPPGVTHYDGVPDFGRTIDDCYNIPKSEWRNVRVPDRDLFDYIHPGITLNARHYGPGVHLVPPVVAEEIEERLEIFAHQNIRVLQPKKDLKMIKALANKGIPFEKLD